MDVIWIGLIVAMGLVSIFNIVTISEQSKDLLRLREENIKLLERLTMLRTTLSPMSATPTTGPCEHCGLSHKSIEDALSYHIAYRATVAASGISPPEKERIYEAETRLIDALRLVL